MLTRYVSFLWQVQEGEAAHFLAEATGAAPRRAAGAVTAAVRAPHGLEVLLETELHASQLAKSSMSEAEGVLSSGAEPRAPPAFARVPALLKQILDKQNAPRAAPPVQPSVAPMFVASSGQPPAPVPELPPFRGPLSAALLKITTPGDDQLDPPLRAPEPAHFTARATGDFLPQARAPASGGAACGGARAPVGLRVALPRAPVGRCGLAGSGRSSRLRRPERARHGRGSRRFTQWERRGGGHCCW